MIRHIIHHIDGSITVYYTPSNMIGVEEVHTYDYLVC